MVRLAVLVSGTGSILEALLRAELPVVLVVADRPCRALGIAEGEGIDTELVDRSEFGGFGPGFDRDAFTARVVEVLESRDIDLVAMAGFGTVLSKRVHDRYPRRILNTHPSLLPAFPGWHAVEEALEAGVEVTGCTVHLATLETDAGPVLAQEKVPVLAGDSAASLHERIKKVERVLYPATIEGVVAEIEHQRASGHGASPTHGARR